MGMGTIQLYWDRLYVGQPPLPSNTSAVPWISIFELMDSHFGLFYNHLDLAQWHTVIQTLWECVQISDFCTTFYPFFSATILPKFEAYVRMWKLLACLDVQIGQLPNGNPALYPALTSIK